MANLTHRGYNDFKMWVPLRYKIVSINVWVVKENKSLSRGD